MPPTDILDRRLLDLVRREDWTALSQHLVDWRPADIAELIGVAPDELRERIFSLVHDDVKPDVLAALEGDTEDDVLEALSNTELSNIIEDMSPDDAADLLADLPEQRSEEVLDLMEDKESADVRKLLEYEEDTAGGIMTTDVVAMQANQTVAAALQAIAYLDTREEFYRAFIVDEQNRLLGEVDIWELLRERDRSRPLGELIHRDVPAVTAETDQEEAALVMSKYDLTVVPVVDDQGRLVGRITADDAIQVIEEEASEDILRLAGSDDAELERRSVLRSCAVRFPWLLITLCGGFVTSLILRLFHTHVSSVLVLAAFVPIVLAMGGNTGIQSSTLIVRSIALGDLKGRSISRLLLREILTGMLMGAVCGLLIGIWAKFVIGGQAMPGVPAPFQLATAVSLALFAAMTFAATFGAIVPIVLDRIKVDPAVASGPFITTANDISALLIYFAVTILLLQAG